MPERTSNHVNSGCGGREKVKEFNFGKRRKRELGRGQLLVKVLCKWK